MVNLRYLLDRHDVRRKLETAAEQIDDPMASLIGRGLREAFEELDDFAETSLSAKEVDAALDLAVRSRNALDEIRGRIRDVLYDHRWVPTAPKLPPHALELLEGIDTLLASKELVDADDLIDARDGRVT
jgi:hypothetical protein